MGKSNSSAFRYDAFDERCGVRGLVIVGYAYFQVTG